MAEHSPVDPQFERKFGKHLEEFLDMSEHMIFYRGTSKKDKKKMKEARKEALQLARRMQRNKTKNGVFKDPDEWNLLR